MAPQQSSDGGEGGPWSDQNKRKFRNKDVSEFYDPCQEAAARSIQCLNRNGGDREMCLDYFQAYRDCKEKWIRRKREIYKLPKEKRTPPANSPEDHGKDGGGA